MPVSYDRMERLFQGDEAFDSVLSTEQLDTFRAATLGQDPSTARQRSANMAWIASQFEGLDQRQIAAAYPALRQKIASDVYHFNGPVADDATFYSLTAKHFAKRKAEREMFAEIMPQAMEAWRNGVPSMQFLARMHKEQRDNPGWDPVNVDAYQQLMVQSWRMFSEKEQDLGLMYAVNTVQAYFDAYAKDTDSGDTHQRRENAMHRLMELSDDDRAFALDYATSLGLSEQPSGDKESKFVRRVDRAVESFVRGAVTSTMVTFGGEEEHQRFKIERELDARLMGQVDPAKADSWLGDTTLATFEQLPRMLALLNPAGIAAELMASKGELHYEYLNQGATPNQANAMSAIAAVPYTALNFLQARMVFKGQVPFIGKILSPIKNLAQLTLGQAAKRGAVFFGAEFTEQYAQEVLQDLTAPSIQFASRFFDQSIPGVNWTKEFRQIGEAAPETLSVLLMLSAFGTGVASFKDQAYGRAYVNAALPLRALGFSEQVVDDILNAETLQEKQTIMQALWGKREFGPEQKAALEQLNERQRAVHDAIAGAPEFMQEGETRENMAGYGIERTKDGYLVRSPEGEPIGEAASPESAGQMALVHARERTETRQTTPTVPQDYTPGGMQEQDARDEITAAFGVVPERVTFERNPGGRYAAKIEDGVVTINLANIAPGTLQNVLLEEGLHGVWSDQDVQDAWKEWRESVEQSDIDIELRERTRFGLDTDPEVLREEAAIRRLLENRPGDRGAVKRFIDALMKALRKLFGMDVTPSRERLLAAATTFLATSDTATGERTDAQQGEQRFAVPTGSRLFPESNRLSNLDRNGATWSKVVTENQTFDPNSDTVRVYRAAIGNGLRPDDFVAISKNIADEHVQNLKDRGERGKVTEHVVNVADLLVGNDATEFVWNPVSGTRFATPTAQTETPEFKRWFGDSKVVDAQGKPMVVYHGSEAEFTEFDSAIGSTPGSWFTTDYEAAQAFGTTMSVYLTIRSPGTLADLANARREAAKNFDPMEQRRQFNEAVIEHITKAGFDGIHAENFRGAGGRDVWMALRPTQIKSAIGNRGTFDSTNPDIRFATPTAQTDTPEFKSWFGGSKVVDAQGKPMVVYHGTTADFSRFDPTLLGTKTKVSDAKKGFFFVATSQAAEQFTYSAGEQTGSVMPVYLAMINPLEVTLHGEWGLGKYDGAIDKAKASGNDGVIIRGATTLGRPGDLFIAFEPTQIKSAIGNSGTFDPTNPDIRFAFPTIPGVSPNTVLRAQRQLTEGFPENFAKAFSLWVRPESMEGFRKSDHGVRWMQLMNQVHTTAGIVAGRNLRLIEDTESQLKPSDRKWMRENFKSRYESAGSAGMPNARIRAFAEAWTNVHNDIGAFAEQLGVMIHDPRMNGGKGGQRPFRRALAENYFPHSMTREAMVAIRRGSGALYDAIVAAGIKAGVDAQGLIAMVDFVNQMKEDGHLEKARLANMPETVTLASGEKVTIMNRNPLSALEGYVIKAAQRLAIIEAFTETDPETGDKISGQFHATEVADQIAMELEKAKWTKEANAVRGMWGAINGNLGRAEEKFMQEHGLAYVIPTMENIARTAQLSTSTLAQVTLGWVPIAARGGFIRMARQAMRVTGSWLSRNPKTQAELDLTRYMGSWAMHTLGQTYVTEDFVESTRAVANQALAATGFNASNRVLNQIGSLVAINQFADFIAIIRDPSVRKWMDETPETARRMIKENFAFTEQDIDRMVNNGIDYGDFEAVARHAANDPAFQQAFRDLAQAAQQMTGRTNIFRESPTVRPPWMSKRVARMFMAYMSMPRALGNVLTFTFREAYAGNVKPLVTLMVGGVVAGAVNQTLKDLLFKREREPDDSQFALLKQLFDWQLEAGVYGLAGSYSQNLYWAYKFRESNLVDMPLIAWWIENALGTTRAIMEQDATEAWKSLARSTPIVKALDAWFGGPYVQSRQRSSSAAATSQRGGGMGPRGGVGPRGGMGPR